MKTLGVGIVSLFVLVLAVALPSTGVTNDKWPGVDETVVEKYAQQHGREAREPFINTDQGDLLLFIFLLGGAVGGFAAGYYWRTLLGCRTAEGGGGPAGSAAAAPQRPRPEER